MSMTLDLEEVAGRISWERMIRAVELVRERLMRATAALDKHGVPYAVVGGNAVATWVSGVDQAAVRNTQDVDILVRREDLPKVQAALATAGFVYHETLDVPMFLDSPQGSARHAVHVLFSGEKVQPDYAVPTPDLSESRVSAAGFRVLELEPLVRMKLTSFRDKDRTHLRDLIDVGLIDASWVRRFPPELAARLQHLFDTPGG
jgi:hypothetical protein